MISRNLLSFIDNLLNDADYSLDVNDISISNKKIILSHILTATEYEEICQSIPCFEAYFLEYEKFIQEIIDDRISFFEVQFNYGKGLFQCKDNTTGETIWRRHY